MLRVEPTKCGVGLCTDGKFYPWTDFFQINEVRSVAEDILAQYPSEGRVRAVLNWADRNLTYLSDMEQFGVQDLFQRPLQFLETRRGDCEDTAFLVASLLQSVGIHTAYVIFGDIPQGYHAWNEIHCKSGYHIVEPQVGWVWKEAERKMISYLAEYVITPNGCYYNLDY